MDEQMTENEKEVICKTMEENEKGVVSGNDLMVETEQTNIKINKESGDHQNEHQFDSSYFHNNNSDDKSKAKNELNVGYADDSRSHQTNDVSNPNENSNNDTKDENMSQYYNSYYANYYQHCGVKSVYPETDSPRSKDQEMGAKPSPKDLINRALAKQQVKNRNHNKDSTPSEGTKIDEDVEEGQIPSSPRAVSKGYSSSSTPSKASSQSTPLSSPRNSQYRDSSKSMSRSVSKERLIKSRSRSRSRRRYISRSRSRSMSRQRRRRSRSRSPYLGPIIKDYRRGRRGFVRYPRGFRDRGMRPFRRGHHSQHYVPYGFPRRHEFSRSRSRSFSPKRRPVDVEKSDANSDEEKQFDPKRSEVLKPSDINMSQKRITQSFLAMLEEKQNRSKMIPIESNRSYETSEGDDNFNKQHGFVNTFNTVRETDTRKHTLSYDLEREGWQVIDDANSESAPKAHAKNREEDNNRYDDKLKDLEPYKTSEREHSNVQQKMSKKDTEASSSSDEVSKKKKKKNKKRKKKKKKKASTSSESSDSESDDENADDNSSKKKSKKKKKASKKKKKVSSSSSSSENDEKEEKHKKKKRKKKKESSSDSETEDKVEDTLSSASNQKLVTETSDMTGSVSSIPNEVTKEGAKTKEKKKKKRKAETSDSSDSDSDKNEKKKKKKNKKKKAKKKKHRSSSSSSSSESSDSSESVDRKKKKKKKSKKSKRSKKHKKDKKADKKEKTKSSNEEKKKSKHDEESKQSEFVTVYSVGDPPLELKWPKKLIRYTNCEPTLQYSINPKVPFNAEDFRQIKDERSIIIDELQRKRKFVSEFGSDNENDIKPSDRNEKLVSEYERFIDELNPSAELSQDSMVLEMKMREKLLKQYHVNNDSEDQDLVTPSEKRAIEKMKKHHLTYDENEEYRRHDDLKSAPLSTYYSAKKQRKSSPAYKNEDSEKLNSKSSKSSESEGYHKTSEISISIGERSKSESQTSDNLSKIDDKKRTARELLERVKQKKHSNKESDNSKDDSHNKRIPHIGKIKKPEKKPLSKSSKTSSITTANADSTQNTYVAQPMKLDMNYDYNWYYKYYMNSYAMGQYSADNSSLAAAYYAQYAMLTSYDYKQSDLSQWMQQRGYTFDTNQQLVQDHQNFTSNQQVDSNDKPVKTEENLFEANVESTIVSDANSDPVKHEAEVNDSTESSQKKENLDKTSQSESTVEDSGNTNTVPATDNSLNGQQNIEVVVSSLHSSIAMDQLNNSENKNEGESSPNMSPFSSAKFKHKVKVRVTTSSQNDSESECRGSPPPPPPPPPPMRPQMTTFTSTESVTLPNGQVLPPGTKQIVVHPYQMQDSSRFTSEWFYDAFSSHNASNTTASANNGSDTQNVVKAN